MTRSDDFAFSPKRSYLKEVSAWQRIHSPDRVGNTGPTLYKEIMARERTAKIKALLAQGLGDGSVAVRLNNEGIACTRCDVHLVRKGTRAPTGYGALEEMSVGRID